MKKNIFKIWVIIFDFLFLGIGLPVFAQSFVNPIKNLQNKTVENVTGSILQKVLGLVGVVTLVLVLYAGFLWMVSQGDVNKIKKSKNIMLYAVIGLFIIFAAYAILKFVFSII